MSEILCISKITLPNGQKYEIKDKNARNRLDIVEQTLTSALIFKGVAASASDITDLINYKVGWCYKASASFTLGQELVTAGDMIICVQDYVSTFEYSDWTVLEESLEEMSGATAITDGARGLVPTPHAGDENKLLSGAGTWVPAAGGKIDNINYNGEDLPIVNKGVSFTAVSSVDGQTGDVTLDYAPLNSPQFYGNPTTPTKSAADYDESEKDIIASLGFVKEAIADSGRPVLFNQMQVLTTDWESDSTYTDYPYKATVMLDGITPSTFGWVIYNNDDFAATCKANPETDLGCIYIYTSEIPDEDQFFNFWSILTEEERGASLYVYTAPDTTIYDPGDFFDDEGMVIHYIAADGITERELDRSEWEYAPTRALTVNDKFIDIASTDPHIAATCKQRVYIVVGRTLINTVNRSDAGYNTNPNLNLVVNNLVNLSGSYYYTRGIDDSAFKNCTNIRTVVLPELAPTMKREGLTLTMGDYVFEGCSNMTSISYPADTDITKINEGTFKGCSSLTNIDIVNDITEIEAYGLQGCSSYSDVDLSKLTAIGAHALEGTAITEVSELQFNSIPEAAFANCSELTDVVIKMNITNIGSKAFANDTALEEVFISMDVNNMFTLPSDMFEGCTQHFDIYVNWKKSLYNIDDIAADVTIHYDYGNFPAEDNYPAEDNFPIDM